MDSQIQQGLSGALNGGITGFAAGGPIGPIGALIGAVGGGALGALGGQKKRPKYNISPEVDENKALAAGSAFGLNPAIQTGLNQADQAAAEDVNTAQNYTANTGSILNVLRSINSNRNMTKQNLLGQGAQIQAQGKAQLAQANQQAIDEKDKAWNYNQNQPYQNQVAGNRDLMKGTTENFWRLLDSLHAQNLLNPAQGAGLGPAHGSGAASAGSGVQAQIGMG